MVTATYASTAAGFFQMLPGIRGAASTSPHTDAFGEKENGHDFLVQPAAGVDAGGQMAWASHGTEPA